MNEDRNLTKGEIIRKLQNFPKFRGNLEVSAENYLALHKQHLDRKKKRRERNEKR